MSFELEGKIALVTGGANGIGLANVKELLKNGVKKVAIVDISKNGNNVAQELNKQYGNDSVIFIEADLINKEEVAGVFETTYSTFKGLDIIINNAGIYRDAEWEKEIALHCNAVVESCLMGIKYMGKNNGGKGGVIVNTSSVVGLGTFPSGPIYTGTKHFVIGLTRSFGSSYYWDLTGIKFVTMCPSVTVTTLASDPEGCGLRGFPGLGQLLTSGIAALPSQSAADVAKGMMTLITKGENGSVWVSEGGESAYEMEIPDRLTLRKKSNN